MDITKRIESYWDKRSDAFNELRLQELKSPNAKAWHALLAQHIPLERPIRILDVGTGTGFFYFLALSSRSYCNGHRYVAANGESRPSKRRHLSQHGDL